MNKEELKIKVGSLLKKDIMGLSFLDDDIDILVNIVFYLVEKKSSVVNQDNLVSFVQEFVKGAYICLDDEGSLYRYLVAGKENRYKRSIFLLNPQSHESSGDVYALDSKICENSSYLFSTIKKDGKTKTWIQLEKSSIYSLFDRPKDKKELSLVSYIYLCFKMIYLHLSDFFKYKFSSANSGVKQNIGPYGSSIYTDSNPIKKGGVFFRNINGMENKRRIRLRRKSPYRTKSNSRFCNNKK